MTVPRTFGLYYDGKRIGTARGVVGTFQSDPAPDESTFGSVSTITLTAETEVGIRQARVLFTGRPRAPRAFTKAKNRRLRELRQQLVHAAGCVYRWSHFGECASRRCLDLLTAPGVKVPRSLRGKVGR